MDIPSSLLFGLDSPLLPLLSLPTIIGLVLVLSTPSCPTSLGPLWDEGLECRVLKMVRTT